MDARIRSFCNDYGWVGHEEVSCALLGRLLSRLSEGIDAYYMISYNIQKHVIHGIVQSKQCAIHVEGGDGYCEFCIADLQNKSMCVIQYDQEKWIETTCDGTGCIDLDVNGKRWEGGIESGRPFGYGVVFDEEGRKEYEGFILNGLRICYGNEYYSDIERSRYSGGYCCGDQCGVGILSDRYSSQCSSVWYKGNPATEQFDGAVITSYTQLAYINQFREEMDHPFLLSGFMTNLNNLTVSDNCMANVPQFIVSSVPNLYVLNVGSMCFCYCSTEQKSFVVVDCPHLRVINIGDSFQYFSVFTLHSLPLLESLSVGCGAFTKTASLLLEGGLVSLC